MTDQQKLMYVDGAAKMNSQTVDEPEGLHFSGDESIEDVNAKVGFILGTFNASPSNSN